MHAISPDFDFAETLETLSLIATRNPNFTLLHLITVGEAMVGLSELLLNLNDQSLRAGYLDFVVAAFMAEQLKLANGETAPRSQGVLPLLKTTRDDHAIKSAYSLTELYRRYKKPIFLSAARKFFDTFG